MLKNTHKGCFYVAIVCMNPQKELLVVSKMKPDQSLVVSTAHNFPKKKKNPVTIKDRQAADLHM